jgi:hypothetical protein
MRCQASGLLTEFGEDRLGRVAGKMRIAAQLSESGGIDQVDMPLDQFGERKIRAPGGKFFQQSAVILHLFLLYISPPESETAQMFYGRSDPFSQNAFWFSPL